MTMTKAQMQSEISKLKEENSKLRKMIEKMERLNRNAFKRQHEAEMRLNALYGDGYEH